MNNIKCKNWWKCAGIRAVKTVCQTAVALLGTSTLIQEIDWVMVLSSSLLAGIISILTSIAGIPETKEE